MHTSACNCTTVHTCARHWCLLHALVHTWCTFWCSHRAECCRLGGGTAPGVPIRVTVGVTGAPAPPLIELQADNSGDIAVPINVPKGATRMELSVSGEGREDMGWGTWGQYGDMGTWGHGMWDV